MKMNQMYPSRYLSKDDLQLQGPTRFIIQSVEKKIVQSEDGPEEKVVMNFADRDAKPWILNKTNAVILSEMFGDESENWKGKTVTLYIDSTIRFGSKRTGGIRVQQKMGETPQ